MNTADSDWRVEVTLPHGPRLGPVLSALREDEGSRLGHRVAVTKSELPRVIFLYAGTEDDAREAELLARDTLARRGLSAHVAVRRWHPDSQVWGGPEVVPAPVQDASVTERRPTAGQISKGIGKAAAEEVGLSVLWGIAGAIVQIILGP